MARGDDDELPRAARPKKKLRVGLVVDHPLRDLDGMCLVAQALCERGHEALLLPFYTQHLDIGVTGIDVIVLNYVRPANRALVDHALARGIALAVLDTEGGLLAEAGPTSPSEMARYLRSSRLDEELALYMFWGEQLRAAILADTRLPASRAVVTGAPRFDLAGLAREGGGHATKRVLVNANFPIANAAHARAGMIDTAALRSAGFCERDISDLAKDVTRVMRGMVEAVRALAHVRPDVRFILRPHPFERAGPYKAAFAGLPNVDVVREGTALQALAAVDCMLHVNCTTAIEASLVGVPAIALEFVNEPRLRAMAPLAGEASHRADCLEDALEMIDRCKTLAPAACQKALQPFFGPLDGCAATRVVAALENACAPDPKPRRRMTIGCKIMAMAGSVIGSTLIEGARIRRHPQRADKRFTLVDVERAIDRAARSRGTKAAISEVVRTPFGRSSLAIRVSAKSSALGPAGEAAEGVLCSKRMMR